jgi:hypothetical protein
VGLVYDPSGLLGVMIARPRVAGMLHAAPGHQHDLEASKSGSSADQSGGSQGQTRPRSETSADGKVKPGEKSRGRRSSAEQDSESEDKDQDKGRDQLTATSKSDSPVFQTGPSGFCSPRPEAIVEDYHARDSSSTSLVSSRLTPSQRRRIQRMRAPKMREEAVEKERDEYFNVIRSVIPTK